MSNERTLDIQPNKFRSFMNQHFLQSVLQKIERLPVQVHYVTDSTMRSNEVQCFSAFQVREIIREALQALSIDEGNAVSGGPQAPSEQQIKPEPKP